MRVTWPPCVPARLRQKIVPSQRTPPGLMFSWKFGNPVMPKQPTAIDADIVAAFNAYEAQQRIANTKVGCALVVTLMPLGSTMDYFFYHGSGWPGRDWLWPFFFLRLRSEERRVGKEGRSWSGVDH